MDKPKGWFVMAFILCCISYSVVSAAQNSASKGTTTSGSTAQVSINSQTTEVAVLKAQLEGALRFQEQILNTVWWALGALATTAALLVGYNWFTNYRGIERERASLRRELASEVKNIETLLSEKINKKQQDAKTQLEAIADERAALVERKLGGQLRDLVSDINRLKRKAIEAERQSWLSQKLPRNALACSVEILELACQHGFNLYISEALGKVSDDIGFLEKKSKEDMGFALDTYLAENAVAVLDKVGGAAAAIANEIKLRLLKIKTKA